MRSTRRIGSIDLVLVVALLFPDQTAPAQRAPGPAARWIGQDGHDLVGPSPTPGPNDVQDIRIAIRGLPPGRRIVAASIRGDGGGEAVFVENGTSRHWRAEVVQQRGATTADLYFEPYRVETGRRWELDITLDDGRTAKLSLPGGPADPNLRMPGKAIAARWVGQNRRDRTGAGPSVGPDGRQDVQISLSNLSPKIEVRAVYVETPGTVGWCFGTNPEGKHNAELLRDPKDPTRADLFFQPDRDLAGTTLTIRVAYANDKIDQATLTASRCDPELPMPAPTPPRLVPNAIAARWLGQDGSPGAPPGSVHVALDGLPRSQVVAAAALSGAGRGSWFDKGPGAVPAAPEPDARPMVFRRRADPTRADLFFLPERDESGGTMTLRLVFGDGAMTVVRFPGGAADLHRLAGPEPARTSITIKPGHDVQASVRRYGTVKLARGTYHLNQPLLLDQPVTLTAEPGATLRFEQQPGGPPWSAAILVHSGRVTLDGFAVRFARPIRWREGIRYEPAVIGLPDERAPAPKLPIADLAFTRLDLESPPAAKPQGAEWAINLMRLYGARNGRIENCTLKGGMIEFFGGPWRIVGNEHRGVPPGTQCSAVFAGHDTHDLVLRDNRTSQAAPAGKTWRFLVLTGHGFNDVVANNYVEGIGPRDNDTLPDINAPETILTEAYALHFEGAPAAIAAEGRLLLIPEPQDDPARTGAFVAVLDGAKAGTGSRVLQALDAQTYLVDPPLPSDATAVSIATGFVAETFQNNTIDARGGSKVEGLVLVGNHFGTKVVGNVIRGGGNAFRIVALPTEKPIHWGWSHSPVLGAVIEDNTIEDALHGGFVRVDHGPPVKSNRGRVYLSGSFRRNTAAWSATTPPSRSKPGPGPGRIGFTLGAPGSLDPAEMILDLAENAARGAAGVIRVHAARLNGQLVRDQEIPLPPLPEGPAPRAN